jgi:hypothetical protein
MGFTEDLESVADTQYFTAIGSKPGDAVHNGAEACNSAAAQVVAIGEAAGKNDAVVFAQAVEVGILVPEHDHFLIEVVSQGILHITIAIGTGENDNSEFHGRMF